VKKVVYFISPQVWAWKPQRARLIGELADHLIVLLPFERDVYKNFPVKVHYEGHPLVDLVKPVRGREGLPASDKPLLALLPGSRSSEIKRHLPYLKALLGRLKGSYSPFVPTFPHFKEQVERELGIPAVDYEGASYDAFFFSESALIASGTASLEAGLAGCPHAVFYRVSPLTYWIGKRLVKVPFVSLVNLLLKEEVVPEVVQKSPQELLRRFYEIDAQKVKEKLKELKGLLGEEGVIERLRNRFREIGTSPQ